MYRKRKRRMRRLKKTQSDYVNDSATDGYADNLNETNHVPGYHYDPESKKYFKIQPGHAVFNGAVTNASIAEQKSEEKRCNDMEMCKWHRQNRVLSQSGLRKTTKGVVDLMNSRCRGDVTDAFSRGFMLRKHVSNLHNVHHMKCDPVGRPVEHMQQLIVSKNSTHVLAQWSFSTEMQQLLGYLKICNIRQSIRDAYISHNDVSYYTTQYTCMASHMGRISNICWAPLVNEPQRNIILYTCLFNIGNIPSLAVLRDIGGNSSDQIGAYIYEDFNLGHEAIWTCSWNSLKSWIGLGAEKNGLLLDVESKKMWQLKTQGSSVYTQQFMTQHNCMSVLSGTKKGHLVQHDLRSSSAFPVMTLNQGISISGIVLVNDSTQVIASDYGGGIRLWDMRKRSVVQKYTGHVNEYTRIPLHVDETETVLYTAGQDCYTRLWDVRTGELLHTIPPPCPASRDAIPSLAYSHYWGGYHGNQGLLMGMRNHMYYYTNSLLYD